VRIRPAFLVEKIKNEKRDVIEMENASRSSLCRNAGQIKQSAAKKKGAGRPPEYLGEKFLRKLLS
jgi:hypothetical protein